MYCVGEILLWGNFATLKVFAWEPYANKTKICTIANVLV